VHHITKYYVSGHTAEGYVNYLSSNINEIEKIIVLRHPSNIFKTTLLEKVIAPYEEREPIEIIVSAQSKEYINGVIIRNRSFAVLDEKILPTPIKQAEYIALEKFHSRRIEDNELKVATKKMQELYEAAYECFEKGLTIHDDLEKVYIDEMDFNKADQVAEAWINKLFQKVEKKNRQAVIYERLFGTNTSDGVVNLVEHLITPIKNRVFIKGRAGTGKSVFMKKVLDECKKHGLDVEVYRCSFDPNSIDMLIIRDLDYCLFDSTDPHEFFPSRQSDEVIDLYEKTVNPGTDEKYATKISQLTDAYKQEMRAGVQKIKETKEIKQEKEALFEQVGDGKIEQILQKITANQ